MRPSPRSGASGIDTSRPEKPHPPKPEKRTALWSPGSLPGCLRQISMSTTSVTGYDPTSSLSLAQAISSTASLGKALGPGADPIPSALSNGGLASSSLPSLPSPNGSLNLEQLMNALMNKSRQLSVQSAVESLEMRGEQIKAENEKQLEELQKQIKENSKKSFWNKFLKAFKIIGAIVGAVASIATTVIGAMTANPLMIAAGVIGILGTVDSITSLASDGKYSLAAGFTELGKACGMSEETANKFSMGMTALTMIATIAVSFGAAGASSASKIATATAEMSAKAASALSGMAKIGHAANIGSGVVQMGSGVGTAAVAVIDHRIAQSKANTIDIDAILEHLREMIALEQSFVEHEMEKTQEMLSSVKSLVEDCAETSMAIQTGAASPA